jgi:hypothetical protein
MTVKTNGAEFNEFYNDPNMWLSGIFHADVLITVDGKEVDEYEDLPNEAIVTITGGWISNDGGQDLGTMEAAFKRWRSKQGLAYMVVTCKREIADSVRDAVKLAGGKVK